MDDDKTPSIHECPVCGLVHEFDEETGVGKVYKKKNDDPTD